MGRERPVGEVCIQRVELQTIQSIDRRAKLLVWRLKTGEALLAHLKMIGFLFVDNDYVLIKHNVICFFY
jgi:formamidopyrimidine-DNA glycosylase